MKFFISLLVFAAVFTNLQAVTYTVDHPAIGVVENSFDDINQYFEKYGVPFEFVKYEDLEKPETYSRFDYIFYPSGIEREINSSIEILARERRIEGVTFNSEFYRIKDEKIAYLMRDYVLSGKTAVCSGYSAKFLQEAFDYFILYNNFPNLGLYGYSELSPQGRLLNYTSAKYGTTMDYDGYWVAQDLKQGEVLLEAGYNTPTGVLKSVAAGRLRVGSGGSAYYLADFGKTDKDAIMRFFTVSVPFDAYSAKMKRLVEAWEQVFLDYAVDKNLQKDNGREYRLKISEGENTVYGFFEKGLFQIDIYDSEKKLIYSENNVSSKFEKTLNFKSPSVIYIKMFSDTSDFDGVVLFGVGSGKRIIPYFRIIRNISVICLVLTLIIMIVRRRRRYSGTYPDISSGESNG